MMLKKFKYNDIQQCHFLNMCDEFNELCFKKNHTNPIKLKVIIY